MGGSLSDKRLSREDFIEFSSLLHVMLTDMFGGPDALGGIEFSMVPYYAMKKDFGDVDYIVRANAGDVMEIVTKKFNPSMMVVNDGVISFTFNGFQIDLICTKNHYETTLNFMAWNDCGNLLGRIFHKLGLKFGERGLLYPIRDDSGKMRREIVVSTDMEKILDFIGCDYEKWQKGFRTLHDLFVFVSESRYFNRGIYDGELSAINKKRDKKRKTFNFFITWLEIYQPMNRYDISRMSDKKSYIPLIDAFFGVNIMSYYGDMYMEIQREEAFKRKFNGELLMELLPDLKGEQLGKFIARYKRHVLSIDDENHLLTKEDNVKFENTMINTFQSYINLSIKEFANEDAQSGRA